MSVATGVFVAVDGPKYSGKTTVLDLVTPVLTASGFRVLRTKEPTPAFDLSQEERLSGHELAQALADDRAAHAREAIAPGLSKYDVVLTDRYIASSLVFQVLDGVPIDQVWEMNRGFVLPDLNVFVTADVESILRRHEERGVRTRFARSLPVEDEISQYATARAFMAARGVLTVEAANADSVDRVEAAIVIVDYIKKVLG